MGRRNSTRNFRQVRWLQVFWSPGQPAAHATLSGLGDGRGQPTMSAVTDDQGNVQLTRTDATQQLVLIGEDGHICRLTVRQEAAAICRPPLSH